MPRRASSVCVCLYVVAFRITLSRRSNTALQISDALLTNTGYPRRRLFMQTLSIDRNHLEPANIYRSLCMHPPSLIPRPGALGPFMLTS